MANTTATQSQTPPWDQLPFYRKNWFVIILFLVFIPGALLIAWTGPVYQRQDGQITEMARNTKIIFSVVGAGLLFFNFFFLFGAHSNSGSGSQCSSDEVLARMSDANAAIMDRIAQDGPSLNLLQAQNAFTAAFSRVQAAMMRGDMNTACKISLDVERQYGN